MNESTVTIRLSILTPGLNEVEEIPVYTIMTKNVRLMFFSLIFQTKEWRKWRLEGGGGGRGVQQGGGGGSGVPGRGGRGGGASGPTGRRAHTAVMVGDSMLIYGGYQDLRGSTAELWNFNTSEYIIMRHMSKNCLAFPSLLSFVRSLYSLSHPLVTPDVGFLFLFMPCVFLYSKRCEIKARSTFGVHTHDTQDQRKPYLCSLLLEMPKHIAFLRNTSRRKEEKWMGVKFMAT